MGLMDMLRGRPSEEEIVATEKQAKLAELNQLRGRRQSIEDNIKLWGSSSADTTDLNNIDDRIAALEKQIGQQGAATSGIGKMSEAIDHADQESRSEEQK